MQDDSKDTGPIDLGRHKKKDIVRLQEGGSGELSDRIDDALEVLKSRGMKVEGATPVIVVVREKPKKLRMGGRTLW